jgi:hypothetical protein
MKNFIIIALVVFIAWVFLGSKAEQLKTDALDSNLGNNQGNTGNASINPDGGENVGTAIVYAAGSAINKIIDGVFRVAQENNPPDTNNATL